MTTIDYDTGVAIVKQLYPQAQNPMLDVELEATKGKYNYRPYAVFAKFVAMQYRQITKADEVSFTYSREAVLSALALQQTLDDNDEVPPEQSVSRITELLNPVSGGSANVLGVFLI